MPIQTGTQDYTGSTEAYGQARPRELSGRRTQSRGGVFGMNEDRVATGLGWFSIGLGLAELLAPRTMSRIVGSRDHAGLFRGYGLREIGAGVGLLTMSQRAPWLWARVAGDAVDLVSLGRVANSGRKHSGRAWYSIAAVAGVTALDIAAAQVHTRRTTWKRAEANMMVDRSPEECYRFWRNFENLPRFMPYLESVRTTGDRTSHWVACGPGGARIEWDAEIQNDLPNQRIAWRSLPTSMFCNAGSVDFERAPGDRGTIIRVQMDYGQPFRTLGSAAKLIGKDPEQMIRKELRRFKQVIETGQVITTEGQPAGRRSSTTWLDDIAR